MSQRSSYFERAAEVLERAFKAANLGEQGALLDEAMRLHQLALEEERAKLARWIAAPSNGGGEGV